MATRWRKLDNRRLRELDALQREGEIEGVRLVPMPPPPDRREPENRRFSAFLTADFGDERRTSARGRTRREGTVSVELELFLPPDFPHSPPLLHCHTRGLKHWAVDSGSGRIDIHRLIEWNPKIELTSLLLHLRQHLLSAVDLSPQSATRNRRSPSPRRSAAVTAALASAMSGDWRATGHSVGTGRMAGDVHEELEEFTLDVRADGHISGYPTFEPGSREDVFTLTGSVKADPRGLRLNMRQEYPHTRGVTEWTATVGRDGTMLTHGKWSGSCAGTFNAERVPAPEATSMERLQAAHAMVVGGRQPEPEFVPHPQPAPEFIPQPEPEPEFASATASAEREKLLWELARSEDKYGKDLQALVTYRAELQKQLPRVDVEALFPGLDAIVALNCSFDDELNETLGLCQDGNAALAVRHGGVCSLFINFIPQMKCYQGYVQSLSSARTSRLLALPEVADTVAGVAAASADNQSFDALRMAPVRRLESYKACFQRMLQLTGGTAPEYRDLRDITNALDTVVERDISPKKEQQDPRHGRFARVRTANAGDLQKIREAKREQAEQAALQAYGPPPSYADDAGGSTMDRIEQERQRERVLHAQADRVRANESRVQRQQELQLQRVVEEVVQMGYDRDLVEKVQRVEQHASPVPLQAAVESEAPKLRRAPPPKFVGISNPSNYCFANATIQCLRHTPQLVEQLMEIVSPNRGGGPGSLIEAFVALLKHMDRGSGVQDNDRARQDFVHQCFKLLPAQPGEETHDFSWCWQDDDGGFHEYDEPSMEIIERAKQLNRKNVTFRLSVHGRTVEYRIENLQGDGDGYRWQVNTATGISRLVERRMRTFTGEPTRIVETDWRRQQQQDAGQFLRLLLVQFSMDKDVDGSAVLGRMLTRPRERISRGVTDAMMERLNQAVRQKRPREENKLLKQFADDQWDSTTDTSRRTAIGKFFQGQTLQLQKCLECAHYSPCTANPFTVDQLDLQPVARQKRASLEQLLEELSAPKRPSEYRCDYCTKVGCTNFMSALVRLPRIYIVHLNRAQRTAWGAETRVATSIDFPDQLNLAGTGRLMWPERDTQHDYHNDSCGVTYRLLSVVFHRGTHIRTGNYYATIRASAGTTSSRRGASRSSSPTARGRRKSPSSTRSRSPAAGRSSSPGSRSPGRSTSPGQRNGDGGSVGWVRCADNRVETDAPCPQDEEFDRVQRRDGGRAVLLFYERIGAASRTADV